MKLPKSHRDRRADLMRGSPDGQARSLRRAACLVAAIVISLGVACAGRESSPPGPAEPSFERAPVILISIDTLRSDHLPIYGYDKVATPAIDTLRGESVLFERAYSPSPMTLPAHVSMLTGTLPATHGVRNNVGYTFDDSRSFYLPCHLRSRGYLTGAAVSTYVLRAETGMSACFDAYDDAIDPRGSASRFVAQQRPGRVTLERAAEWIAPRAGDPFFYFFHIYEPHVPYEPPEPYRSLYPLAYDGEIALADEIVGRLIAELRAKGVWDRAIVILTSDHGEGLGDHGEEQHSVLLNRELIQVPLLIKLPGGARGGETVTTPVQLSDLVPTVLALLGDSPDAQFEGEPLLSGALNPERLVFAETLYPRIHLGWSDLASLVKGPLHYIEGPRPELYDLVADPAERNNLAETERRALAGMREAIAPFRAPMKPLESIDPETAKNMAALGYIGSPAERSGPLPDPKERIRDLETIREALLLGQSGRAGEAEAMLRSLIATNPEMVEGWVKLGDVLTLAGDYPGALDAMQEAVRRSPIVSPDLVLDAGHAALRAERYDEAASLARAAMPTAPRRAYDLVARVEIARGRFREAESAAREARHDPERPEDLVLLATAIQKQGRFDEALAMLDAAEKLAASSGTSAVWGLAALRADTLARSGEIDEAKAAYQAEVESFPSNLKAWSNLAVLVFLEGDRQGVDRLLVEMATANPGPGAKLLAAKTLEVLEDPSGAARWRRRAAKDR